MGVTNHLLNGMILQAVACTLQPRCAGRCRSSLHLLPMKLVKTSGKTRPARDGAKNKACRNGREISTIALAHCGKKSMTENFPPGGVQGKQNLQQKPGLPKSSTKTWVTKIFNKINKIFNKNSRPDFGVTKTKPQKRKSHGFSPAKAAEPLAKVKHRNKNLRSRWKLGV